MPSLCHHKDLTPAGSCRLCMAAADGLHTEAAACARKVTEGMVVYTEIPRIAASRKAVLQMFLDGYHDVSGKTFAAVDTELGAA